MASVQSLGVGSGLLTSQLVDDIIKAERDSTDLRISTKKAELDAKLSAFDNVRGSVEALRGAASALGRSSSLLTNSTTSTQPTAVTASATTRAELGVHSVEVSSLARAHTLASIRFDDITDTIGDGTLTFRFGTTTLDQDGEYTGFEVNPDRSSATVTIDAAHSSVTGVRDAINNAMIGVSATIVNDGEGFRLVLTSRDTGAANSMEIVAAEGDTAGLSALAFNASAADPDVNMEQTVAATDAAAIIDGIPITRSSNTVSEVVAGVTFQLVGLNEDAPAVVTIAQDTKSITDRMQAFVDAFNQLRDLTDQLTAFDAEKQQGALLMGDSTLRGVRSQLRRLMGAEFPGLGTGELRSLVDLGVTTDQNDNFRLKLDAAKLSAALAKDPAALDGLLATTGSTTDSLTEFIGAQSTTESGDYAVNVTRLATHGHVDGAAVAALAGPITIDGDNDDLVVRIDGVTSGAIALTQGEYADGAELAAELTARINADTTFANARISAIVTYDADAHSLILSSAAWGARSSAAIVSVDTNTAAQLGLSVGNGVVGVDVAGRINGIEGIGSGQFLSVPSGPQQARAGFYEGATPAAFPITIDATSSTFSLSVDGNASGAIELTHGTYATGEALAIELQTKINADAALGGALSSVTVAFDAARGAFTITSDKKGLGSSIAFTDVPAATQTALGIAVGSGTAGRDATTINDRASGLQVRIAGGDVGDRGRVTFTRGAMNGIDRYLTATLGFRGAFGTKVDSLEAQVAKLDEEKARFDARMTALEQRLRTQFAAADALISQLNSTSSYLDQQLKNLTVLRDKD
jgi:flagellar hook-associated protein 2